MAVLSLTNAHLAFGHVPLLDGTGFALEAGERLGLIGRNGAGKSSLLKIAAGLEKPDDGLLQVTQGLRIRYVPQEPAFDDDATVFDAVADGVAEARELRATYEAHPSGVDLDALQTRIEALDAWNWETRVATTLQRLALDGTRRIGELSGGTKKRVALAQALVALPDVLLLDEPTNHLDLDAIAWLEDLLREFRGSVIVVTHDRAFLDAVCTRILELDRGRLRSYPGNFAAYERAKEQELAAEALAHARADKLLAQEEAWIRQGVEARRTRSVARVQRLQQLRAQRAARREALGQVRLDVDAGTRSGRIVAELTDVTMRFGDKTVVDRFSATILRGDKVGLIGPNGAGKTTLLKLILGELAPTSGTVRRGTKLQVAYFDQMRSGLDLDATLADTISPGSEWIDSGGGRKHVMSYLGDFLFAPERAHVPVRTLSGGERNRLLLARLFALPANVLVLDEPTNDLDIDTLELLEQLLQDYTGTVFLVSHDRRFLDNVVTSTIAYEGDGRWREYEGGYEDWQRQRARSAAATAPRPTPKPAAASPAPVPPPVAQKPRKLGFKEQRELDELPARIEALEAEQKAIAERLASTDLYTCEPQAVSGLQARYAQIDDELTAALERWEALASR
ncbi:ATP-binding cassette domain-containing protein [Calidifontimicrobium sp. SYSU G02091]|uniref:ATP-binding cassette domain-containing protein n=1 Tax=Calidifontimicrobium sp. SYSU G02091 TaxID=2926421 RepID=UPI001F538387|nr:ATP-binding cassette domain-containing protein [Calidifontimicrobium sp. SYSU G02091]MCI1193106.1 ATP-binding cassette domain-containing protein [Calidifontimicrobium sp. SYSU G02091]